jgi:hypothetical protein
MSALDPGPWVRRDRRIDVGMTGWPPRGLGVRARYPGVPKASGERLPRDTAGCWSSVVALPQVSTAGSRSSGRYRTSASLWRRLKGVRPKTSVFSGGAATFSFRCLVQAYSCTSNLPCARLGRRPIKSRFRARSAAFPNNRPRREFPKDIGPSGCSGRSRGRERVHSVSMRHPLRMAPSRPHRWLGDSQSPKRGKGNAEDSLRNTYGHVGRVRGRR